MIPCPKSKLFWIYMILIALSLVFLMMAAIYELTIGYIPDELLYFCFGGALICVFGGIISVIIDISF